MRFLYFFFFNDTATTEIYTLSLHDALPISRQRGRGLQPLVGSAQDGGAGGGLARPVDHAGARSEEHTSELQSRPHLVCRLLLEKKKSCKESPRECRTSPELLPTRFASLTCV